MDYSREGWARWMFFAPEPGLVRFLTLESPIADMTRFPMLLI